MYNSSGTTWISLDRHRIQSVFGLGGQWKLKTEIFISFNRDIDLERSLHLGSNSPEKKDLHYATKDSKFFFFLSQHTPLQVPRHHPKRQSSPHEHLLIYFSSIMTPPVGTGLTHVHQALCNWTERVLLGMGLTTIKAQSSFRFTQVTHCSGVLSILAPLFLRRNPEIAAIILLLQRRGLRQIN